MRFCLAIATAIVLFASTSASGALVAYWDFEEGSGSDAGRTGTAGVNDDPINGTEGTDFDWNGFGAPTGGNNSLNFTGLAGRVESTYLGIGGSADRSVAFWIRTSIDNDEQSFVTWGDSQGGNGRKWHVRMNDDAGNGDVGAIRTEIQGSFEIGSVALNDGEWHHIASVYEAGGSFGSGQVSHYVDGVLVSSSGDGADGVTVDTVLVGDGDAGANTTPVWIGSRRQGTNIDPYTGDIDEVRIYDNALTLAEVQQLAGIPEPATWLLGLLTLAGLGCIRVLRSR